MKWLIDNQLPTKLVAYLSARGHDCSHILDLGLDEADDLEVWRLAGREERVLISKDGDFVFLANRPGDTGRLVWVRLGNCRNVALMAAFDRVHDALVQTLETGQRIVELR